MSEILAASLAMLLVCVALFVLWAIIRFGVVSARRTRGAAERLRRPDAGGVERVCGFGLPPALAAFYRESDLVERGEFAFIDGAVSPPARWFVGGFIPLAAQDVREWRVISGVPGVPIADDGDKGIYYVARNGAVRLASPNVPGRDILVTASAADFFRLPVEQDRTDPEHGVG
jgi:hypothetical protein